MGDVEEGMVNEEEAFVDSLNTQPTPMEDEEGKDVSEEIPTEPETKVNAKEPEKAPEYPAEVQDAITTARNVNALFNQIQGGDEEAAKLFIQSFGMGHLLPKQAGTETETSQPGNNVLGELLGDEGATALSQLITEAQKPLIEEIKVLRSESSQTRTDSLKDKLTRTVASVSGQEGFENMQALMPAILKDLRSRPYLKQALAEDMEGTIKNLYYQKNYGNVKNGVKKLTDAEHIRLIKKGGVPPGTQLKTEGQIPKKFKSVGECAQFTLQQLKA